MYHKEKVVCGVPQRAVFSKPNCSCRGIRRKDTDEKDSDVEYDGWGLGCMEGHLGSILLGLCREEPAIGIVLGSAMQVTSQVLQDSI